MKYLWQFYRVQLETTIAPWKILHEKILYEKFYENIYELKILMNQLRWLGTERHTSVNMFSNGWFYTVVI